MLSVTSLASAPPSDDIAALAVRWLTDLVRIDTTNPPGGETCAARYLADVLRSHGLEPIVVEPAPGRGSVVARLRGTGEAPPILLTGHLDVVPAAGDWSHPPFSAAVADGMMWGRGTIDCKSVVVQSLATLLRLSRDGRKPARDVIFAAVADEECGGKLGAGWLVDHRPELVRAEYAVGEIGGIGQVLAGRRIYPIQVAEKGTLKLRFRIRSRGAHGALPGQDSAIQMAARVIRLLSPGWWHRPLTPSVRDALARLSAELPLVKRAALGLLSWPGVGTAAKELAVRGRLGPVLRGILCDTLVFTSVAGVGSRNTVAAEVELVADARILPGTSPDAFVAHVRRRVTPLAEVVVLESSEPVTTDASGPLYDALAAALSEADPGGVAVPYLMPGGTDAKAFARLGTRWFGFSPIDTRACPGIDLFRLYHAVNERIPVDGFRWGVDVHTRAISRLVFPT